MSEVADRAGLVVVLGNLEAEEVDHVAGDRPVGGGDRVRAEHLHVLAAHPHDHEHLGGDRDQRDRAAVAGHAAQLGDQGVQVVGEVEVEGERDRLARPRGRGRRSGRCRPRWRRRGSRRVVVVSRRRQRHRVSDQRRRGRPAGTVVAAVGQLELQFVGRTHTRLLTLVHVPIVSDVSRLSTPGVRSDADPAMWEPICRGTPRHRPSARLPQDEPPARQVHPERDLPPTRRRAGHPARLRGHP